jgi:hypothetical protein
MTTGSRRCPLHAPRRRMRTSWSQHVVLADSELMPQRHRVATGRRRGVPRARCAARVVFVDVG